MSLSDSHKSGAEPLADAAGTSGMKNRHGRLRQTVEVATDTSTAGRAPADRRRLAIAALRAYGLIAAWAILVAVFGALRPSTFLTVPNFATMFGSQAVLLVLALALIIPFAAGEFDLSITGVMSVSLVLVGYLNVVHEVSIIATILIALAAGIVVGCVNAALVVGLGLQSIIVTLGMGTLLYGVGLALNITTTAGISPGLTAAAQDQFLSIPLPFYYGLGLTIIAWYVFDHTPLGRYLYFVGSSSKVAALAGIPVRRIRVGSLIASSVISALAGILLAGTLGAADPNVSSSYLLPAFAAAFLGATAIRPGRFNALGTFIAVYFLITGIVGLETLGMTGWVEDVYYGASLVIAVAFSQVLARHVLGLGKEE